MPKAVGGEESSLNRIQGCTAIAATILLFASSAQAFCRKTTCELSPTPSGCTNSRGTGSCIIEGLPLFWRSPCLSFSVQRDGSKTSGISARVLQNAVRQAFDNWTSVTCSQGGNPTLAVASYPRAVCSEVGFREGGPNQNLWVFRDSDWGSSVGAEDAIALTTLTVNEKTGEILDADVELNAENYQFTTGDENIDKDLLGVVQHESGHVLGLDHTVSDTSTMGPSYVRGSTVQRTLQPDDVEAICAVMPPGEFPEACDPEPLGGFSTECAAPSTEHGCCAVAPGMAEARKASLFGLLMCSLLTWQRQRRRPGSAAVDPTQARLATRRGR